MVLDAGDERTEDGIVVIKLASISDGASSDVLDFKRDGLLQTFFRMLISCRAVSEFPSAAVKTGEDKTFR